MSTVFRREQAENYQDKFECLPAGRYRVMITEVEDKETKSGTGKYLRLKFQVLDGQYVNWITSDMINYKNDNPKAEEIGWQQLKKCVRAIWGEFPEEFTAEDLKDQILEVTTKIDEYNGSQSSKVKSYVAFKQSEKAPEMEEDDFEVVAQKTPKKAEPVKTTPAPRVSPRPASAKASTPF